MKHSIQSKITAFIVWAAAALTCFGLSPNAQAVTPPPSGGYPNENTAVGQQALFKLTNGSDNTGLGFRTLYDNTSGSFNTATGATALRNNRTGDRNTATGHGALFNNVSGTDNTANGFLALRMSNSSSNTAIGSRALELNTTGHSNIAVGFLAGRNLTTGNNNIDIGHPGVAGESSTIRIGSASQTKAFITGISGAVVTNGAAVFVNAGGQLGTSPSSERFKDAIKPMDKVSEAVFALEPVTFRYKKEPDPEGTPQFGLVAEDVEKVNPDLVVRDSDGKPYTVRYDAVNAMLLNEFLKEHRKVEDLESALAQLTARLKEQDSKIQKMSEQLEMSRPAPQVIANR
jgi:hypothetical protein